MITKPLDRAFCFDFDDTIVKTRSLIHVYDKQHNYIDSFTYDQVQKIYDKNRFHFDFSDFNDPSQLKDAIPYVLWDRMKRVSDENQGTIYIITARSPLFQRYIYKLLKDHNINIEIENIMCVGDDMGESNIPKEKAKILKKLTNVHDLIHFWDDQPLNIIEAKKIPGVKAYNVQDI
jgi:hypothetical protein